MSRGCKELSPVADFRLTFGFYSVYLGMVKTFSDKTALLIDVIVKQVLEEKPHTMSPEQVTWFVGHCEQRFCYFYETNTVWRRWLENRSRRIDPRLQCKVWIRHWLAGYQYGLI